LINVVEFSARTVSVCVHSDTPNTIDLVTHARRALARYLAAPT